jgi:hypothetical protein
VVQDAVVGGPVRGVAGGGLGVAVAGGQVAALQRGRRAAPGGLELAGELVDVAVAAGEQLDHAPVNAGHLEGMAVAGLLPLKAVAELVELGGQLAGVDRLGG